MPLTSVLSVQVRPDRFAQYQELVRDLATRAVEQKDDFRWTAHQTAYGELGALHFVSVDPDFAGIAARGNTQELIHRVFGEEEGARAMASMRECTISQESTIVFYKVTAEDESGNEFGRSKMKRAASVEEAFRDGS